MKLVLFLYTSCVISSFYFCPSVVITVEEGLEKRFLEAFYYAIPFWEHPVHYDPFIKKEARELACEEHMAAGVYIMDNNPDLTSRNRGTIRTEAVAKLLNVQSDKWITEHPERSSYADYGLYTYKFLNHSRPIPVKLFACVLTINVNWFIAYGYNKNVNFVVHSDIAGLKFTGISEPTPTIDLKLTGKDLETYAVAKLKQRKNSTGNEDHKTFNFCSPTFSQQLRLCGQVNDAMDRRRTNSPRILMERVMYYNTDFNTCMPITLYLPHLPHLSHRGMKIEALPCAIDTDWSTPQFYLAEDWDGTAKTSSSVLVIQNRKHDVNKLNVKYRVTNVSLLTYP